MVKRARLMADREGVSTIEFALLAPLYLFIVFGTLEIGFALLFNFMLNYATEQADEYLMTSRENYQTITQADLRKTVCSAVDLFPIDCGEGKLKIALINADTPATGPLTVEYPIENRFDDPAGEQYILAIGYYWGFLFPTTIYALPFSGPNSQIQSINFVVLAERVTDG